MSIRVKPDKDDPKAAEIVKRLHRRALKQVNATLAVSRYVRFSFWVAFGASILLLLVGVAAGAATVALGFRAAQADAKNVANTAQAANTASTPATASAPETPSATKTAGAAETPEAGATASAAQTASTAETGGTTVLAVVLGALSAASFLGVYVLRPLDSLERNAILFPLITGIVSVFCVRVAYSVDNGPSLKLIVDDLVSQCGLVLDKYAAATGKYIGALKPEEEADGGADDEDKAKPPEQPGDAPKSKTPPKERAAARRRP